MKFLANENFPLASVHIVRSVNYDIKSITEISPGITDDQVLEIAVKEQRIILTFDRDYGELIYRLKKVSPPGVIYFRYTPETPEKPGENLIMLVNTEGLSFQGKFTVVELNQLRQRPLP